MAYLNSEIGYRILKHVLKYSAPNVKDEGVMKRVNTTFVFVFSLLLACSAFAQDPSFDLDAYRSYLESHSALDAQGLLSEHQAPLFRMRAGIKGPIAYLDSTVLKLGLTVDEQDLLRMNGFVVSERLSEQSFIKAFARVWHEDLPLFLSTDAILHALHRSYDNILKSTELDILLPALRRALDLMHGGVRGLKIKYPQQEMVAPVQDVDVFLTVARALLAGEWEGKPVFTENRASVDEILSIIKTAKPVQVSLMMSTPRLLDFSQFTVRGHYTDKRFPELAPYFRAMMWLGRTEILFSKPVVQDQPIPTEEDIRRQTIDAFLLRELAGMDSARSYLDLIDDVIASLIGESDNVTLRSLDLLASEIGLQRADELLDADKLRVFRETLESKSFAGQRINSQILISNPLSPVQVKPPSVFMLMGQRFIIDSYIMGNVVYDRILKDGEKVWRPMPSTLDVLFALGNNAAAQLLQTELRRYHYALNLAALRYLVDSYEAEFWNASVYTAWLNAVRMLNVPADINDLPPTMQTAAYWQQKMNTQLGSWTELRHDNLLYGKQSYTSGSSCSYPAVYLEPFPEFYRAIADVGQRARALYAELFKRFPGHRVRGMISYFDTLSVNMLRLRDIADKERSGKDLTDREMNFLRQVLFERPICGVTYDGWFTKIIYGEGPEEKNFVVADVHTQPTDYGGAPVGRVLHVGTGEINLGVYVMPAPGGGFMAYTGPAYGYYEFISENFKRLTDEEWPSYFENGLASKPDWVNIYLADKNGSKRSPGRMLITGIDDVPRGGFVPGSVEIIGPYPNPFSGTTLVGIQVPASSEELLVHLRIYDALGHVVRTFALKSGSSGSYVFRWDGRDDDGKPVPAGVYFVQVVSPGDARTVTVSKIR